MFSSTGASQGTRKMARFVVSGRGRTGTVAPSAKARQDAETRAARELFHAEMRRRNRAPMSVGAQVWSAAKAAYARS